LVKPGSVSGSLVSSVDIGPTVLELVGVNQLSSFQGHSFVPLLGNPAATIRSHAFADHNWHCTRAYERAVFTTRFCYTRNWLPHLPNTPPPDAVKPPSYQVMIKLWVDGKLPPHQSDSFLNPRPREELFDLESDPLCMKNLAADPRYRETLHELRNAMVEWRESTGDHFPGETELTPDQNDRWTGERFPTK
jgi:arylsulfatase A-like enzyme